MKIGVITSAYPDYEDDPHGIFVHRLMREISKLGYDVHVLAPFAGGKTKYDLEGVNVERFNYFYPKRFQKLAGRSGMIDNVKEGFWVKFQVISFILFNIIYSMSKFREMDIIHVQWPIPNGLGALFLKKLHGIPYINTIHGEEIHISKRYHMILPLRLLVRNSSKTITNSTTTRKFCLEAGLDAEKIQVIPFGVDTKFFQQFKFKKEKDTYQILSVGYLIERKGFEYLIRAIPDVLKKHKNVKLKIIGSGPLESKLKSLINDLNLGNEVEIIKNVSDEELLNFYNYSDLFVLPSIVDVQGNTEGLGVVLLEAMACGVPVIASNVGGITDIITNNDTGLLFNEKDSREIAQRIIYAFENETKMHEISEKGLNVVKTKFSLQKVAKSYIKCYRSLK